jgi:hypothetical protein
MPSLQSEARKFADCLQALLNRTVCDNAKIGVVHRPDQHVGVGTLLDRELRSHPVRLRTVPGAFCWLDLSYRLFCDPEGYLTVRQSFCLISAGEAREPLFHYDYERDKDSYTEPTSRSSVRTKP